MGDGRVSRHHTDILCRAPSVHQCLACSWITGSSETDPQLSAYCPPLIKTCSADSATNHMERVFDCEETGNEA